MKKLFFILFALPILIFSSCGNTVQSVDLSQITFDGVSVGDNFKQIETDKYTTKSNISNRYTYNYEEWRLSVDGDTIIEIMASFDLLSISINGAENFRSVDDIIDVLGEHYVSSWYDREQSLMQIQYTDRENELLCSFVYNKNSNNLVWGIMQAS